MKADQPSQLPSQQLPLVFGDWYSQYESCIYYFVHRAQHCRRIQAVAAFINIRLPLEKYPVDFRGFQNDASLAPLDEHNFHTEAWPICCRSVSINSYIRRLVATGLDSPSMMTSFFGDDWTTGVNHILEAERRNYMFAAKSSCWLAVKSYYDMVDGQDIPFLEPLHIVTDAKINSAESDWSRWLAMQDWMLGPRAPAGL